jgi:CRP-like cAMP-binding protein
MAQGVPKAIIEMLHRVPLLSACTQAELRQVADLGERLNVPDGKVLIQQGKPGRELFMLLGGKARCYVDGTLMATFETGDFFGEMALLKRRPRQATVVADGPAELLVLDGRDLDRLVSASPAVAMRLLQAMATRQEANATLYD